MGCAAHVRRPAGLDPAAPQPHAALHLPALAAQHAQLTRLADAQDVGRAPLQRDLREYPPWSIELPGPTAAAGLPASAARENRCSALSQLGEGRLPAPERAPKDTPLVHPLTRMVKRIRNPPRSGGGQAGFAQRAGDQMSAGEPPAPTKCEGDPLSSPLRPLPTARRARRLRTSQTPAKLRRAYPGSDRQPEGGTRPHHRPPCTLCKEDLSPPSFGMPRLRPRG